MTVVVDKSVAWMGNVITTDLVIRLVELMAQTYMIALVVS
jgi:hypothetical protein